MALSEGSDGLYLAPAALFGSDAFVVQREFCDPLAGALRTPPLLAVEARLRFLLRLVQSLLLAQVEFLFPPTSRITMYSYSAVRAHVRVQVHTMIYRCAASHSRFNQSRATNSQVHGSALRFTRKLVDYHCKPFRSGGRAVLDSSCSALCLATCRVRAPTSSSIQTV